MKKLFYFALILAILLTCTACYDGYAVTKKYPYYKSSYWYCEEIDFAFYYEYFEDGRMKNTSYPLKWEGETLNVIVDFIIDNWYIEIFRGDELASIDDQILSGTWSYQKGNLVFKITEDKLFNGQYQELVFVPGKLE